MTSTSASDKNPNILTKLSDHPLAQILLGDVVGAYLLGNALILYYTDHHQTLIAIEKNNLVVADYQVPSC